MPIKVEHALEKSAEKHHFKKGSKRYNAYVYGTMNKLGLFSYNHAGNLGPDKLLNNSSGGKVPSMKSFDYEPTFPNVHGVHIGICIVVIVIIYLAVFGYPFWPKTSLEMAQWADIQYNSLGAQAGALTGEAD